MHDFIVLFTLLGRGPSSILSNENQEQSPSGNEVIIGDMVFTQEQYELLYGQRTRSGKPANWTNNKGRNWRWPENKLPYRIDSSVLLPDQLIIEKTISRFNSRMSDCFSIV